MSSAPAEHNSVLRPLHHLRQYGAICLQHGIPLILDEALQAMTAIAG